MCKLSLKPRFYSSHASCYNDGNPPSPVGDATRTGDARGLANATLTAIPHGGNPQDWTASPQRTSFPIPERL
ncbi:hypothetical protein [Nostoc sp.]|uniref:hypothetical protein n=1 Tax=Nostoc sp. TaxID=1180 RepID=UPI002FF461D0